MRVAGWSFLLALIAAWPQAVSAQQDENLKSGRILYEQSCGVCHDKPTLVSRLYGPALSQETLEGREELIRAFITNGSQRMPGFKVMYEPAQIAAIAAYIKTLPKPPAEAVPDQRAIPRAPE
jgi:mono/diheme cytochrome c family protein